ncbi:MAG: hypothetical protein V8Q84_11970 [Bilophila sp.]
MTATPRPSWMATPHGSRGAEERRRRAFARAAATTVEEAVIMGDRENYRAGGKRA